MFVLVFCFLLLLSQLSDAAPDFPAVRNIHLTWIWLLVCVCVRSSSYGQEIAAISSSARKRLASSGLPRTSEDGALREIKRHAHERVAAGLLRD